MLDNCKSCSFYIHQKYILRFYYYSPLVTTGGQVPFCSMLHHECLSRSGQVYFKCSTLEPRLRFGCRKIRINVKMPTWLFDHKSVTNRIPSNKDHIFCNVPSSAQSYFEGWKVINIQVAKMLNHLTKTATICVMYSD